EDAIQVVITHMVIDGFAQHAAKVGSDSQVAAFPETVVVETRPLAIDLATFYRAAEDEHDVGVSVVGAAVAVFARGAARFRHGYDDGIFGHVAQAGPDGSNRLREVA